MTTARHPFHEWIRLEQPRLGSFVTYATDEFFAAKERLIEPREPVFVADRYDDNGKWMDGWESRRRRSPGHDHCILRLGIAGIVHGVDIDTRYFTGNHPPEASIDACVSDDDVPAGNWTEILGRTPLEGDRHHYCEIGSTATWTHLRLNIYPDGGLARLRVYGEIPAPGDATGSDIDLVALENGGRAIACSDEHFGSMHNLNLPGRAVNMWDGWETARRRGPGNDWVVLALGRPGTIDRIEVDTAHFKGNYPDRVSIEAAMLSNDTEAWEQGDAWRSLLPESKLEMDRRHEFHDEVADIGTVSHVRMSIYPDGGVSRLRLFGRVAQ